MTHCATSHCHEVTLKGGHNRWGSTLSHGGYTTSICGSGRQIHQPFDHSVCFYNCLVWELTGCMNRKWLPETLSGRLRPSSRLSGSLRLSLWRPIFSLLQCPVLPEEWKDLHTQNTRIPFSIAAICYQVGLRFNNLFTKLNPLLNLLIQPESFKISYQIYLGSAVCYNSLDVQESSGTTMTWQLCTWQMK